MKAIRILPLSEKHLAAAAQLEQLCFAEPWSEQALVMLTREGGYGVVALTESGTVVGYGGMILAPDDGQITNIAVHPDHRRNGYGNAVLHALLRHAKDAKLESVSLEVRVSNTAAIKMYEAAGFAEMGRRKGFYQKPTEDALVMVCKIK